MIGRRRFCLALGWAGSARAVGAVHAAVASQELEHGVVVAVRAFAEPLAGVGRHLLNLRVLANRASQHGSQLMGWVGVMSNEWNQRATDQGAAFHLSSKLLT